MKLKLDHTAMRRNLMGTTVLAGVALAIGVSAMPVAASAQSTSTTAPAATVGGAQSTPQASGDNAVEAVVVTGSIIRRRNADSISPLTVLSAQDIEQRGQTTVSDVIQNLSGNNQGALPNSFSANGAFASGASGASLRGLTTDSTLVLIDGLRLAYYPLADDATRNFVDLNTIPSGIIDRVEVLKDGASATYGADAIAGVINVITKKSFDGLTLQVDGGVSEHGGGDMIHANGLFGKGDLNRDGWNFYLSAEYEKDYELRSSDRDYPYNTNDFSKLCGTSIVNGAQTCRTNGIVNGIQFNNTFAGIGTDNVPVVRPYNAANTAAAGDYRLLNPSAGCGMDKPVTIAPGQATVSGFTGPVNLCQQDNRALYGIISPEDERFSLSGRATIRLGEHAEAYAAVNYYQNEVSFGGTPRAIRAVTTPAATGVTVSTAALALPIYVCPTGGLNANGTINTCTAASAGATLNPNNPFAAAGQVARIFYSFGDIPVYTRDFSQAYRFASGIKGDFDTFGGNYQYNVDFTASQNDLQVEQRGNLYYPGLIQAVNTGVYNFTNPAANTAAVRNLISPTSIQNSRSDLVQLQASLSKELFTLPGGPLVLGIGGAVRYESLFNPSANDDANGAAFRYFSINPFGASGSRNVKSFNFEFDAPIIRQFNLTFSGRYDDYSTGQSNFSPKVGAEFKPIQQIKFRTTYSEGFRIPSFAESFAVPSTGFTTVSAPAACLAAHGGAGSANATSYCTNYSLGLTTVSSPNLQPETSQNFNAGVVLEPIRNLTFSADFYRIKKNDVIAGGDYLPALAAYYSGAPIPAGLAVVPDVADPAFPNAQPRAGFVRYGLQNLDEQTTSGYDLGATARFNLPFGINWTSTGEATYIIRLNQKFPDGSVQHYAGTLGPYSITAASGTPKWKANWENTFTRGPLSATVTVYYTDGYLETAEDNGGSAFDDTCLSGVGSGTPATFRDNATPVVCHVSPQTYVDLHASYQVTKRIQLFMDVKNLFDRNPSYDPTTYGASNYNPAWGAEGIVGRYFKFGAKATF